MLSKDQVLEALREVYDPEIPFNVVDLGLVYGVEVQGGKVDVKMTLTAPGCGMGAYIANTAQEKIMEVEGVEEANVEMVFDPPWSPDKISDAIKKELGIE